MNLESKKVSVNQSSEYIFNFLTELNNFEKLMPESCEKFEVDGDSFIFGLKGMPEIRLVLKESKPNSEILLGAASSKLDFTLQAIITESGINTDVQLLFKGEFNPMMAMMVKKPLTNFIDVLITNIGKL